MSEQKSIVAAFTGMSSLSTPREYNDKGECGDLLTIHYNDGDVVEQTDSKCEGYYALMKECTDKHGASVVRLTNCFGGTGGPQKGFSIATNLDVKNQVLDHESQVRAIVTVNGLEDETFYAEVRKTIHAPAAPTDLIALGIPRPSWMAE